MGSAKMITTIASLVFVSVLDSAAACGGFFGGFNFNNLNNLVPNNNINTINTFGNGVIPPNGNVAIGGNGVPRIVANPVSGVPASVISDLNANSVPNQANFLAGLSYSQLNALPNFQNNLGQNAYAANNVNQGYVAPSNSANGYVNQAYAPQPQAPTANSNVYNSLWGGRRRR